MGLYNDGFTESKTYGWSVSHGESTTEGTSDAQAHDILADIDTGRCQVDKLHLDINLRSFRTLLRCAARRLTVAQFSELRRRYEDVWQEVLGEL